MSADKLIQEYKELVATFVRQLELERSRGDKAKIERINQSSDDDLISRMLWKVVIVGSLVCFLILPFAFYVIGKIISVLILGFLWTLLRLAMGLVLILLALAIYMTVTKSSSKE